MSPEYSIQNIREKNNRAITAALLTIQRSLVSKLETQPQAHSDTTITLSETTQLSAQIDLIHSSFDAPAANTAKERAMILSISFDTTPIAMRTYFYQTHSIAPSYVHITSSLEVFAPFKRIGIGTTLLQNDRGFQEIAGQLVKLFNPQVTTILASYADQTIGSERFWTTRRLADERKLPLINGNFKEEFPIPTRQARL